MTNLNDPLISVAEAARQIDRNRSTLSRHVKSGAVRSHEGKVRLSEVLEDLASNIDLSRSHRGNGQIDSFSEPQIETFDATFDATADATNAADLVAPPDEAAAEDETVLVDGAPMSYAQARALKEHYLALLRKLEFETKRGDLAPVDVMVRFVERMFSTVRERLLGVPGKLSGELDVDQVERLTIEIHEALEELSDPSSVFGVDAGIGADSEDGGDPETAAETQPRPMGGAIQVCGSKDERRARPLANERAAGRLRSDDGRD